MPFPLSPNHHSTVPDHMPVRGEMKNSTLVYLVLTVAVFPLIILAYSLENTFCCAHQNWQLDRVYTAQRHFFFTTRLDMTSNNWNSVTPYSTFKVNTTVLSQRSYVVEVSSDFIFGCVFMTVVQAALTDCSATHELSVHAGSVHSGLIAHNDHSTAEREAMDKAIIVITVMTRDWKWVFRGLQWGWEPRQLNLEGRHAACGLLLARGNGPHV